MLPYPAHVWTGTLYDEFAEVCRRGNNIPYEFLVESIKTVMGAVVGKNLTAQGEYGTIEGAIPRFYTVMITDGQGGKGTSIKYALNAFKVRDAKGLKLFSSRQFGLVNQIPPRAAGWDAELRNYLQFYPRIGTDKKSTTSATGVW